MFWKRSDTDYINSIRRWVRLSKRFILLNAVIYIAWLVILALWHLMLKRIWATLELAGDETASLGFMLGAFTAVCWFCSGFTLFTPLRSAIVRPWRLFLDYHDRLQKAALIEEEHDGKAAN
jgi:hypothetical protein